MLTRRDCVLAGVIAGAAPMLSACSSGDDKAAYDASVRRTWLEDAPAGGSNAMPMRELVRHATLAPSSHNTQCWKFSLQAQTVSIHPDLTRRCPAVDPDDHHLFVSLGCAAENLLQAAMANGLRGEATFETLPAEVVRVTMEPDRGASSALFQAISKRQCTRGEFDGKPLLSAELKVLESAGTGPGVKVLMFTEKSATERILEYVVAGNTEQLNDAAFMKELKSWVRFDEAEALRTGDGLSTRATGNPSLPRWLASPLFNVFISAKSENDKYAKQVRSSAGIAVFVSDAADKAHWVQVGRCYERFALQATVLGVRTSFLNQPVEVVAMRPQLAGFLGIGGLRPDLVVRFGRGPEMPRSLRRSVEAVLA